MKLLKAICVLLFMVSAFAATAGSSDFSLGSILKYVVEALAPIVIMLFGIKMLMNLFK